MGALLASDVTVNLLSRPGRRLVEGVREAYADIVFGDGIKTYPTNGIPLPDPSVFGFSKGILFATVEQPIDGYFYKIDRTNNKLVMLQALGGTPAGVVSVADHTHDIKLIGGITATEAVAVQGGDTLGKNAASNRTIAGADSATKGGVVAKTGLTGSYNGSAGAAGPFAEVANSYTPALTTIRIKLEGN